MRRPCVKLRHRGCKCTLLQHAASCARVSEACAQLGMMCSQACAQMGYHASTSTFGVRLSKSGASPKAATTCMSPSHQHQPSPYRHHAWAPLHRHPAMAVAQAAVGYLSAVIRVPFNDIVDPPRNIATIRLPAANIGSICAIHAEVEQPAAGVSMTAVAANHGHVLPDSVDCVSGWQQLLRLCLDCVYWQVRFTAATRVAPVQQCSSAAVPAA